MSKTSKTNVLWIDIHLILQRDERSKRLTIFEDIKRSKNRKKNFKKNFLFTETTNANQLLKTWSVPSSMIYLFIITIIEMIKNTI